MNKPPHGVQEKRNTPRRPLSGRRSRLWIQSCFRFKKIFCADSGIGLVQRGPHSLIMMRLLGRRGARRPRHRGARYQVVIMEHGADQSSCSFKYTRGHSRGFKHKEMCSGNHHRMERHGQQLDTNGIWSGVENASIVLLSL